MHSSPEYNFSHREWAIQEFRQTIAGIVDTLITRADNGISDQEPEDVLAQIYHDYIAFLGTHGISETEARRRAFIHVLIGSSPTEHAAPEIDFSGDLSLRSFVMKQFSNESARVVDNAGKDSVDVSTPKGMVEISDPKQIAKIVKASKDRLNSSGWYHDKKGQWRKKE